MYLCDRCAAMRVNDGTMKPLSEVYGANDIPWKRGQCDDCGDLDNLWCCPQDRDSKPNKPRQAWIREYTYNRLGKLVDVEFRERRDIVFKKPHHHELYEEITFSYVRGQG